MGTGEGENLGRNRNLEIGQDVFSTSVWHVASSTCLLDLYVDEVQNKGGSGDSRKYQSKTGHFSNMHSENKNMHLENKNNHHRNVYDMMAMPRRVVINILLTIGVLPVLKRGHAMDQNTPPLLANDAPVLHTIEH